MLTLLLLERVPAFRRHRARVLRSFVGADLLFLLTGLVVGAIVSRGHGRASEAIAASGLPRLSEMHAPRWASVLAAVVLLDMGNYLVHALMHRSRALWELHKVHHSSRALDWLATFRAHVLEQVLRNLLAPLLLVAIGFPMRSVALAAAVTWLWAMLIHSNLRIDLGFLERVLITPRLHRLHHVPATTHRNLGTIFSVWDVLLGRLVRTDAPADAKLGVPGEIDTWPQGFLAQSVQPLRRLAARRRRRRFVPFGAH
jgi:lathosterol oxidase